MQRFLDVIERVGNKVPHPSVIFLILIVGIIVLSHVFFLLGTTVDYQIIDPLTHEIRDATTAVRSLISIEGRRFMLTSVIPELPGIHGRRHGHRRHGRRRARRGNGAHQDADQEAGDRFPARHADLHPGVRGNPVQHRRRCRLPGADPARRSRVPERGSTPRGRTRRGLRRRRRRVRREHADQARRRCPDGNHQRRDPPREPDAVHRPRRQSLFLDRLRSSPDAGHRAHQRPFRRTAARRVAGTQGGRWRQRASPRRNSAA